MYGMFSLFTGFVYIQAIFIHRPKHTHTNTHTQNRARSKGSQILNRKKEEKKAYTYSYMDILHSADSERARYTGNLQVTLVHSAV